MPKKQTETTQEEQAQEERLRVQQAAGGGFGTVDAESSPSEQKEHQEP